MKRASGSKNHSAAHKAKGAFEADKGGQTVADWAQAFCVHASQIAVWKKHLLEHAPELFERGIVSKAARNEEALAQYSVSANRPTDWLKKVGDFS